MNERDTHFKKFSELLAYRIGTYYDFYTPPGLLSGEFANGLEKLLAQAAYDLVEHTIHAMEMDTPMPFQDDIYTPLDIPDLVEWPEKRSD